MCPFCFPIIRFWVLLPCQHSCWLKSLEDTARPAPSVPYVSVKRSTRFYYSYMDSGAHRSLFAIHCSTTFEVGILVWWLADDTCCSEFSTLNNISSRWMFQAHLYASSFLRRYVLHLLHSVSYLLCAESCSMGCYELTSNCEAILANQYRYYSFLQTISVVSDVCWAVVLWIVKSSILAFYWRLFSARSRSLRVLIWALWVLVTCWGIAVVRPRPSKFKLVTIGNSESPQ